MAALDNLVFDNFTLSDKQNTLNVRLFDGAIRFAVFPKERVPGNNKPLLSISFDRKGQAYAGLMKVIDMATKGPLGTKVPMTRTEYNIQTRQRTPQWTITIEKDSDMCYWITLTVVKTNASFRFPIMASQSYTIGNEPASKAEYSALGLNMLVAWLKLAQRYAPLTAEKPGARGQGRSGFSGAPKAGQPAAQSVDPEDIPF